MAALSDDPNVIYVSPDRSVGPSSDRYAYAVNAPAAWTKNLKGSGVTVVEISEVADQILAAMKAARHDRGGERSRGGLSALRSRGELSAAGRLCLGGKGRHG